MIIVKIYISFKGGKGERIIQRFSVEEKKMQKYLIRARTL
jgi:hypothetical protein